MSADESPVNPKKRGLGRGLNALFEDEETAFAESPVASGGNAPSVESGAASGRKMVGIEQLQPSTIQPRKLFEEESLQELAASIRAHGLLQPILVRAHQSEEGQYEIIAGERRWRASQRAQLHEVPIIIREMSDVEALEIALIENLQREDLNPVDEAMGYKRLMDEYEHTQEKLSEALGKSRSHIANTVRLLNLPDIVLGLLERGDLSAGHARTLLAAENAEELAKEVVAKGLSVRDTEKLVAEALDRPERARKTVSKPAAPAKGADTLALEEELSNILGMRVSIDTKDGQSGKFVVEWKSLDQLDEILKKIKF